VKLPLQDHIGQAESSKGPIDQHKFATGRKSLFRCNVEEILKRQLII